MTTATAQHHTAEDLLAQAEQVLAANPAAAAAKATASLQAAANTNDAHLTARAELTRGTAHYHLGDLDTARTALERAEHLTRHTTNGTTHARALIGLARIARDHGDLTTAAERLQRALHAARHAADRHAEADALNNLAAVHHMSGRADLALQHLELTLTIRRQLNDRVNEASCRNNLGILYTDQGDYARALEHFTHALNTLENDARDARFEASCLINVGRVYADLDEPEKTLEVLERARALSATCGDRTLTARVTVNAADATLRLGRTTDAERMFTEALTAGREARLPQVITRALHGQGMTRLRTNDAPAATTAFNEALTVARDTGDAEAEADALLGLGEAHTATGDHHAATQTLERALHVATTTDQQRNALHAHQLLATLHAEAHNYPRAYQHLKAHQELDHALAREHSDRRARYLAAQLELETARNQANTYRLRTEALEHARTEAEAKVQARTRELEAAQLEIVTRLALAAEYRDDQTGEHTMRVGHRAAILAHELHLDADEIHVIRLAARLHDVGKIALPDAILLKQGRLTAEEFERVKQHTLIGERILSGGHSNLLRRAREIAAAHHERWDGTGYPLGLKHDAIPLAARIVAVADVFDALTSERPYKRAWTPTETLEEITRQSGKHFDPNIVEALHRAMRTPDFLTAHAHDDDATLTAPTHLPVEITADRTVEHLRAEYTQVIERRTEELIAARREAEALAERIRVNAHTDALTGLPNRHAFETDLDALTAPGTTRAALAVITVDLDDFRAINDRDGTDRADNLLRDFALAFQTQLRGAGRAYRTGGDEFAAILDNATPNDARDALERVRAAEAEVTRAGYGAITASAGVAFVPHDARSGGDAVRVSDARMFAAKLERRKQGNNQ